MLGEASAMPGFQSGRWTAPLVTDLRESLRTLLASVLDATGSDVGALLLLHPDALDPEADRWVVGADRLTDRISAKVLDSKICELLRPGRHGAEPAMVHRGQGSSGAWIDPASRVALVLPLVEDQRTVGVLQIESTQRNHYEDADRVLLRDVSEIIVFEAPRLVLRELAGGSGSGLAFLGRSPAFRRLQTQLRQAARCDNAAVLLLGERGSGKELAARAIHGWSRRRRGPFVPVLASSLPETLAAAELFGHERAAFTGADSRRLGRFEAAQGGTLFLDEVADLSPSLQAAVLRALENKEVCRLGKNDPVTVDIRVVAATNRDLHSLVHGGGFRADLLDRLAVFEIEVPPLRERMEDIALLADHFLLSSCAELQRRREMSVQARCSACGALRGVKCSTPGFHVALEKYGWPGNVRELRNLMLRLMATVREDRLDIRHLPEHVRHPGRTLGRTKPGELRTADLDLDLDLDEAIRRHISKVLKLTANNKSQAARLLGIPYTTLQSKLKRLGMHDPG